MKAQTVKLSRREVGEVELIDVLNQRKWWRSAVGVVRRKDMTPDHRSNTLAWLLREAQRIMAPLDSHATKGAADYWIRHTPFVMALEADVRADWRDAQAAAEAVLTTQVQKAVQDAVQKAAALGELLSAASHIVSALNRLVSREDDDDDDSDSDSDDSSGY